MSNKVEYKNNYKSGISLIVLIITIIVSLILVVTAVISTTTAIDNARLVTFSKNLTEIQDSIESYYMENNEIPMLANSNIMSKDELLAISGSQDLLLGELTENNDVGSQFYTIDLDKINVKKIGYGKRKLGDSDIFVVAYPSFNIYYPLGIAAKGTTYFSITSKISNVKKIAQVPADDSTTSVISSGGITVKKTNSWANKMGVNIEAKMASDELLYMSVSGDPIRLITTTTGTNTFGFNLLTTIINDTETIKVPSLTAEEANYIELGTKPLVDRYIDILKYRGTEIIDKVRINLSNFSKNLPTITNATLSSYVAMNNVELLLASSESGIKEVRYEYLTKYTDNGTIENYTDNVSDFNSAYMLSKAKKANTLSDLVITINAPKNVQSIKIAVIDNAGNINLYNQEIAPRLYIGYSIDSSTTESLQLTAKMFSTNGIKSITFSKSFDGINFVNQQIYTLDTTTYGTTIKQSVPYTSIPSNIVYVKMVAYNYDNTLLESRIIKINLISPISNIDYNPIIPVANLGRASQFAVLAGSTITNVGLTTVNGTAGGDMGLYPGAAFPGLDTITQNGSVHIDDTIAIEAKTDLVTAYNEIAAKTPEIVSAVELGAFTLFPGIYTSGTFGLTGTLTLDAKGDPNAMFIFKASSTVITAAASNINLINGAKSSRVFWLVGSSATLGASSTFCGHILALTSITVGHGTVIKGQLLARNAAVTLDTNTITNYIDE